MRIEGSLSKWKDDRGFGFITPAQGGQEIFVHVSAFPKDGVRPWLGERLTFEIEIDGNGKKRAKNLLCPQRPIAARATPSRRTSSYARKERPGFFRNGGAQAHTRDESAGLMAGDPPPNCRGLRGLALRKPPPQPTRACASPATAAARVRARRRLRISASPMRPTSM